MGGLPAAAVVALRVSQVAVVGVPILLEKYGSVFKERVVESEVPLVVYNDTGRSVATDPVRAEDGDASPLPPMTTSMATATGGIGGGVDLSTTVPERRADASSAEEPARASGGEY